jgi:DNA polymerase
MVWVHYALQISIQNLPSRGVNGKKLKNSMLAPEGYMMVDCDSSQIEARVLAWLAGQDDLVQAFANEEDVYIKMASKIYNIPEEEVTKDQRFVGKTTILGAGYGMGALRFTDQLQSFGTHMDVDEARRVIRIYRDANWKINTLWRDCQNMLVELSRGNSGSFGPDGIIKYGVDGRNGWILLPSGLKMRYDDLQYDQGERGPEFKYRTRRGYTRIYGGKVTENVCQAIARCIIGDQMLAIAKKYKVALTVHDSVVCCVPEDELEEATRYIEECMSTTPPWAEGLPITCESDKGKSYGEAAG